MSTKKIAPKALPVSIVIPVYNEENYLAACLDSIKAQTVKPLEVIVVDNNSTDKTAAIARRYKFVKLISESQQGVTFARNRGFDAAKGDLIGRIDADTVLPPDWIAKANALFIAKPLIDAVSGPTGFYDLPGPGVTLFITSVIRGGLFHAGKRDSKYLFGSNMVVRRPAWRAVRKEVCTRPRIHEDNDLAIHLDRSGYYVDYSGKLVANISVRRTAVSPGQALDYAFSEFRTYRYHGVTSFRALVAGLILLTIYPGLKFNYRAYDAANHRYSWHKLLHQRSEHRPNPMG